MEQLISLYTSWSFREKISEIVFVLQRFSEKVIATVMIVYNKTHI